MSLIDDMLVDCVYMNKAYVADGSGGKYTTWTEGADIKAAIALNSTMEARIADAQGVSSVYTITTVGTNVLKYNDVLKRLSDGQIFRITSNGSDKQTPAVASFNYSRVTAEKWELTND